MAAKLEVESKFELDQAGFERLMSAGRVAGCEEQLNVYYDSRWLLAEHSATFRIRFRSGDAPILTLKLPVMVEHGRRVMREFELPLSDPSMRHALRCSAGLRIDVAAQLPVEMREQLLRLGVALLERVGWMRNARFLVEVGHVGCLELDRTLLPDGRVVYEAEIETDDDSVHDYLCNFVRMAAPSARRSEVSKFQRFRRAVGAGR